MSAVEICCRAALLIGERDEIRMSFSRRISRPVVTVSISLLVLLAYGVGATFWRTPNPVAWPQQWRADDQSQICRATLRRIDIAIQEWALEHNAAGTAAVPAETIRARLAGQHVPACPSGGAYSVSTVEEPPRCSVPNHGL